MADQSIRFRIASSFEGEGCKAWNQALRENQKELQSSVRGLGELASAFGAISPEAQAAVGQVKGFVNAFVTGGVVGGVIQLAISGISKGVEYLAAKMNEAREAAKKMSDMIRGDVASSADEAAKKYDGVKQSLSNANKEAQDLVKVLNGKAANEAANKIFEINKKKLEDLADAMTDSEKTVIEAVAAREVAAVKAALADEKNANAADALATACGNAAQLRAAASERLAAAENAVEVANSLTAGYQNGRNEILARITEAENQYAEGVITAAIRDQQVGQARLELAQYEERQKETVKYLADVNAKAAEARQAVADADAEFAAAQKAVAQFEVERNTARIEAATADLSAEAKITEAKEKEAAEREDFLASIDAAAEKMKETSSTYEELLASAKGLKGAQDAVAKSLKDGGDGKDGNLQQGQDEMPVRVKNANEIGSSFSVGVDMAGLRGDIGKPRKLDAETWERFKNGTANVADRERVKRFQEMEQRYGLSRLTSDTKKFINLMDKPKSWLSERDRQFMQTYKNDVAKQIPKDLLKEMFQSNADNILTSNKMKEILKNDELIQAWVDKYGLQ